MAMLCPGNLLAALTESGSAVDGGSPGPAPWNLDLGGQMGRKYGSEAELQGTIPSHGIYFCKKVRAIQSLAFTLVDDIDFSTSWGPNLGTRCTGWVC